LIYLNDIIGEKIFKKMTKAAINNKEKLKFSLNENI